MVILWTRSVQIDGQSHWSGARCDSAGRVWPAMKWIGQGLEGRKESGKKGGRWVSCCCLRVRRRWGGGRLAWRMWPSVESRLLNLLFATGHEVWVQLGHPYMYNFLLWFPEMSVKSCLSSSSSSSFYQCHYYYFALSLLRQILSSLWLAGPQSQVTPRAKWGTGKSIGLWTSAQIWGAALPPTSLIRWLEWILNLPESRSPICKRGNLTSTSGCC